MFIRIIPASLLATLVLLACSGSNKPPAAEETLNIYTWADYIAPDTVANFEHETGIKVRYTTFDTNEVLATQLLTGHTNYDIVVPVGLLFRTSHEGRCFPQARQGGPAEQRQSRSRYHAEARGARSRQPVRRALSVVHDGPRLQRRPGPRTAGTAEFDSWSLLLDPKNAAKLQDCGIQVIDSATDVLSSVLIYLGKDPDSRDRPI